MSRSSADFTAAVPIAAETPATAAVAAAAALPIAPNAAVSFSPAFLPASVVLFMASVVVPAVRSAD
nr:MAG TPA: hypothetical protein [Caudoviricetes sp.]